MDGRAPNPNNAKRLEEKILVCGLAVPGALISRVRRFQSRNQKDPNDDFHPKNLVNAVNFLRILDGDPSDKSNGHQILEGALTYPPNR